MVSKRTTVSRLLNWYVMTLDVLGLKLGEDGKGKERERRLIVYEVVGLEDRQGLTQDKKVTIREDT